MGGKIGGRRSGAVVLLVAQVVGLAIDAAGVLLVPARVADRVRAAVRVRGVALQLGLGLLEPLRPALAALDDRTLGGVHARLWIGSADLRRLLRGGLRLLVHERLVVT